MSIEVRYRDAPGRYVHLVLSNWHTVLEAYDSDEFGQVEVLEPNVLETTNDFTKKRNPTNRHWKGAVFYKSGGNTYEFMRVRDVVVTTNPTSNADYGKDYVYIGIPDFVRKGLQKAIGAHVNVNLLDPKFEPSERWWVVVNSIADLACISNASDELTPTSVDSILSETGKPFKITCDLTLDISFKTTDGARLRSSSSPTYGVAVDAVCGTVTDLNVDEEPPKIAWSFGTKISQEDLIFSKKDVTPGHVFELFRRLGIGSI